MNRKKKSILFQDRKVQHLQLNELSNKTKGLEILRKMNAVLLGENIQLEDDTKLLQIYPNHFG